MINTEEIIKQLFDQRSQLLAIIERRIAAGNMIGELRTEIDKIDKIDGIILRLLTEERLSQPKK